MIITNIEAPRPEEVKTLTPSTRALKILAVISVLMFVIVVAVLIAVVLILYFQVKCVDNDACKTSDYAACGCGRQKTVMAKIINGKGTVDGEWPFQISLQLGGNHICGATLVACRWILSAAHCFENRNDPEKWTAVFGLRFLNQLNKREVQHRAIKKIIIHPQKKPSSFNYDVALLELEHPVEYTDFVQPVCLPTATTSFTSGRRCIIIGWGTTEENGISSSNELLQTEVMVFNKSQCQKVIPQITPQMICAGYLEGGRDACQGDSGGPLLCQDENSQAWLLAGTVSFGVGCGRPNQPGVYARTTTFQKWIREIING
ncbi:transmembrane protease serine 6-like isoform X1 [Hemiscyllium ocellatum]|uniref:transmembrane protease serine 6-like isoform X1 n=1 Tax=Hemiscyllium ocellatum TaxID=170820 RepID=UPI0029664B87|nr:transmembrane protease serine 6-like isoform X1 [Hemiscyllium ocellatum]